MEKKQYHHPNLRETLIEAGIQLMNEKGIEALSLRQIALSCGVSHAAPYRHFADKNELLKAMQRHVEERFTNILEQTIEKSQGAKYTMVEFGKAYVRFFCDNPQYFPFFTAHTEGRIVIDANTGVVTGDYRPFTLFQAEAIKHFEAFQVPEQQYQTGFIYMWSQVHGLASMAIMQNVEFNGDWERMTENVLLWMYADA